MHKNECESLSFRDLLARVFIAVIVLPLPCIAISVCAPFFRELQIAKRIGVKHGTVHFESLLPAWVPGCFRALSVWDRVTIGVMSQKNVEDAATDRKSVV